MKIIFSRKGFDSAAGGTASALVGERPVSFPIPSSRPGDVLYRDLPEIGAMVADLAPSAETAAGRCHLDPDLDERARKRPPGWRGALGQVGAAQGHLSNQGVGRGDLFLFWGLFRPVVNEGRWRYVGPARHCLFGWLQVEEVVHVADDARAALNRHAWLADHPHVRTMGHANNTIYVARQTLDCEDAEGLPGWGMFRRARPLTSGRAGRASVWEVPDWLNAARGGTGMSYHPAHRWSADGTLECAARGQEFVADVSTRPDARAWLSDLFRSYA